MLINLTHHPSAGWPAAMKIAAEYHYKQVQDWPFPAVDPLASTYAIKAQAQAIVLQILEFQLQIKQELVILVMGEMTLTYQLVRLLKEEGITCVASATERVAKMLPDGKRISEFHFKQFREY